MKKSYTDLHSLIAWRYTIARHDTIARRQGVQRQKGTVIYARRMLRWVIQGLEPKYTQYLNRIKPYLTVKRLGRRDTTKRISEMTRVLG